MTTAILASVVTDGDVWNALRLGDPDALAVLFDRHSRAVYNFAFRRTSSWSVAEDALQATFTTVWRRAADGRLDSLTRDSALLNQSAYYDERYPQGMLSPAVATARFDVTGVGSGPGV